ncbi:MAG: GMC oxidoreductase [Gemmatimonadota bacterium]
MTKLSTPIQEMKSHYDVVVVGSGYGGSIAASRLARAGLQVCLLERGGEFQPGDFPEGAASGVREVQVDQPNRRTGSLTALFDFRMNPDIGVLVGCGLGGTSLINANVAIEPDRRVWEDPRWPEAIRADLDLGVAHGFQRAREMLEPTPLPASWSPPKTQAMEKSAAHMGAPFLRPPITVAFEDRVNAAGVQQTACNGCGNCVGGCNVGAKNTLAMNYLPDARNHGAAIFTLTSVRRVEKRAEGWLVHFDLLEPGLQSFKSQARFVGADRVILAAGSLGSTEILLRSGQEGLSLSRQVGQRFTGNGDVLGFGYNADQSIRGVGVSSRKVKDRKEAPGPCITGLIDLRGTDELDHGMIVEEGVVPSTLAPILASSFLVASRFVGRDTDEGLADYAREKYRELQAVVPGGSTGAVGNTQTFLVMAHDDAQGAMHLEDDRVRISWPGVGGQDVFHRIDDELLKATEALGGTYVKNPMWAEWMGKGLMTVHPLGGCVMGESAESGVVDHLGRVFRSDTGDQLHAGLYVCDGSVIPRALGVNPFLTIAALAERTAMAIAAEDGLTVPYDVHDEQGPDREEAPDGPGGGVGLEFTEAMRGHFLLSDTVDFQEGARRGKEEGSTLEFTVTVRTDDLDAMLEDPHHQASIHGVLVAPAVSPDPLPISGGAFHLLTRDAELERTRRMRYRLPMVDRSGRALFLNGFKLIHDDAGFDVWEDTTTLFVTLHEGSNEQGAVLGRGILKIQPKDFIRQMGTFKVTNAGGVLKHLKALARFGSFFAGSLWDTYGGRWASLGSSPSRKEDADPPG